MLIGRPGRRPGWAWQVDQFRLQRPGSATASPWHIQPAPLQREPAKLLRQRQPGWHQRATSACCRRVQVGDQCAQPHPRISRSLRPDQDNSSAWRLARGRGKWNERRNSRCSGWWWASASPTIRQAIRGPKSSVTSKRGCTVPKARRLKANISPFFTFSRPLVRPEDADM
jgi:hypothetical protein